METILHAYTFDTRQPEQAQAYQALKDSLKAQGLECFETWGAGGSHYLPDLDGQQVTLETKHLFGNQWNTEPIPGDSIKLGRRVHDWAQDYPINFGKHIKRGHYLDQTDEMRAARTDRLACGYCGHQESRTTAGEFCPKCIGSEYLKQSELRLTRMAGIGFNTERAPLTVDESARLVPLYLDAQTKGHTVRDKARIEKARADIVRRFVNDTESARAEHEGGLWILDNFGPTMLGNAIFYSHTGRWCFGWRNKLSPDVESRLLDKLSEFQFPYDLETERGKVSDGCADGVQS